MGWTKQSDWIEMKKDKTKDIIRGVLPATRNGAGTARKDIAATKRHGRRKVNERVRNIHSYDDYMDDAADLEFYPDVAINDLKYRRRDFDNLGALLRWARYHCDHELKGRPDIEKYYWFKNLLPDSLQGRHALGHIKDACLEIEDEFSNYPYFNEAYYAQRRKDFADAKQREHDELHEMIVGILVNGYHKRYNQMLKRNQLDPFIVWLKDMKQPLVPKRLLGGWHDVDDFVAWLEKHPRHGRIYMQHTSNNFIDLTRKFVESL